MKLFYDLRVDRLVAAPGQDSVITGLGGKAGDGATEVKLIFGRSSDPTATTSIVEAPTWTPENLAGGTVIKIGIKEEGDYSDGVLLASNETWTHDAVAFTYTGYLDLNTNQVNTALGRDDANAANDIASLACSLELTYQLGGSGGFRSSVDPVEFTIYHDILFGDEATPTNAGDPTQYLLKASGIEWLPTVTSQIGGTSADLDKVPTVGVTVGKAVVFADADTANVLRVYQLTAGTNAENAPSIIRPDDYNASTNQKVWTLRKIDASSSTVPSSVVTVSANLNLVVETHNYAYVEATSTISTITIPAQITSAWTANSNFWIVNRKGSGSLTIAAAPTVTLINSGSVGSITLTNVDRAIHIWRSAENVWRVIS